MAAASISTEDFGIENILQIVVMQSFHWHNTLIATCALIWQGHVDFIQGQSPPLKAKTMWNVRYRDLNSDLPVCLSTGLEEITPS